MEEEQKIDDMHKGAFQVARKLFDSELWNDKPSSWKVIWIYILGKVNHKAQEGFERGEGYFNFTDEKRRIGKDITEDMIKKFLVYARSKNMISTIRSTRGMRLKVSKYGLYQTLSNYESTTESTTKSTREAREKHADKQECKNDKKEYIVAKATGNSLAKQEDNKDILSLMALFKERYGIYPPPIRKGNFDLNRMAAKWLIKTYTLDGIKNKILKTFEAMDNDPFCPKCTSPLDFKNKMSSLIEYFKNKQ